MKISEKQFKDEINEMASEAWEKMGYPATPGWAGRATDDEKHHCGRYRALEDVLALLEKK